jgi:hypothetical protein
VRLTACRGVRGLATCGWRLAAACDWRLPTSGLWRHATSGSDLAAKPCVPRDPARLEVFQLAHGLVLKVYAVSALLPHTEQFGLQAQLRRAAVSIPTNIVEGCARHSGREYQRFIDVHWVQPWNCGICCSSLES